MLLNEAPYQTAESLIKVHISHREGHKIRINKKLNLHKPIMHQFIGRNKSLMIDEPTSMLPEIKQFNSSYDLSQRKNILMPYKQIRVSKRQLSLSVSPHNESIIKNSKVLHIIHIQNLHFRKNLSLLNRSKIIKQKIIDAFPRKKKRSLAYTNLFHKIL